MKLVWLFRGELRVEYSVRAGSAVADSVQQLRALLYSSKIKHFAKCQGMKEAMELKLHLRGGFTDHKETERWRNF
jgi:hypothetical protein